MNVTTPEIFGILVTSFNELVHHMTADYGLVFALVISIFVWILNAAYPSRRLFLNNFWGGWHFFTYNLRRTRAAIPYGFSTICIADYLVLVFLNLMGW